MGNFPRQIPISEQNPRGQVPVPRTALGLQDTNNESHGQRNSQDFASSVGSMPGSGPRYRMPMNSETPQSPQEPEGGSMKKNRKFNAAIARMAQRGTGD